MKITLTQKKWTWADVNLQGLEDESGAIIEWYGAGSSVGFECQGCGACTFREGGPFEDNIYYSAGGWLGEKFLCGDCLEEICGTYPENALNE